MNINPIALALWLFSALLGYLIDGSQGAILGLTISVGISLIASIIATRR